VLLINSGEATVAKELYIGFYLPAETARGLNDHDTHVHAGTFQANLAPGGMVLVLGSAESNPSFDGGEPLGDHLSAAGLSSISEMFDGDSPFAPKGCIAQAWSVGEVLRAFSRIERRPARSETS
jgi:Amylo-alpha-1,6-glucosidase